MKHKWRALTGAAVAAAMLGASLIAAPTMAGAVVTSQAVQDDEDKVVVCKYVTTPDDEELLQTGNNPIVVSANALGDGFDGEFPYSFSDGHGTSVAIGWDGQELGIEDCPGYETPPSEVTVAVPIYTPPTCDAPADLVYPNTVAYSWELDVDEEGIATLTASANQGYILTGPTVFGPYPLSQFSADDPRCIEVVPVPALFDAGAVPPTCEEWGALPELGDFENVALSWNREFDGPGTYVLTATTAVGYTFADGTTVKQRDFVVEDAIGYQSENPEAPCYFADLLEAILTTPTIHDVCGTDDDFADLPADTEDVTYQWWDEEDENELDVVAVIDEDYTLGELPDGWEALDSEVEAYVYEQPDFTDVPCPVTPPTTPPAPTTPSLAATGGSDLGWGPLAAGASLMLAGLAALIWRRVRA